MEMMMELKRVIVKVLWTAKRMVVLKVTLMVVLKASLMAQKRDTLMGHHLASQMAILKDLLKENETELMKAVRKAIKKDCHWAQQREKPMDPS